MDFGMYYRLAELDLLNNSFGAAQPVFDKPRRSADVLLAEASPLGRAYIDWSPMPVVRADPQDSSSHTVVTFQDPRFLGGFIARTTLSLDHSPLTGTVTLDAQGRIIRQTLDGRTEPLR
jgi:inner membrane protein